MLRYLFTLSLALMLAACGGASDSDSTTTDADTDTTEPTAQVEAQTSDDEAEAPADDTTNGESFSISITGAETFDFEDESAPIFGCVENEVHVQTFTFSPKLDIYMKSDIEPGTYSWATFDANAGAGSVDGSVVVSVSGVELDSGRPNFYFTSPEGEFIITSMPSEIGDMFVASFNGTVQGSDGETITVSGDLNLETSGSYFLDCAF